ncbi:MarR family winged helix-turn-helix transcriptional regulator [Tianweitania sp.]|uniref:MarR family winged helix-turn-helix transcriptional regulator n=1 Tax=Tianweitania sp. TaxID=2021634 RepID=UPI00289A4AD4|nr:MarR family transcriptional regulator [Tianweitania sp.]
MESSDELVHPDAAVAPGYLANHAARVFNRLIDAALRPDGMSLSLLGPILLLSWKGPMLQRDLVRASAVKQPAMVALLDKLEAMKLIERSSAPNDRRVAMVHLTSEGRAAAVLGGDVLIDTNRRGLKDFSDEEAGLLVGLLQRLITNLEQGDGTKYHE